MNSTFLSKYRSLVVFLLFAVFSTVVCGALYLGVQQNYRSTANDPQVDATEQIVAFLNQGAPAEAILSQATPVNVKTGLGMFVNIYDKDYKAVSGSGKINGNLPVPPQGVFEYLKNHDEQKFTWEPEKGTRISSVIRKADDGKGFVLAGRSLREVEKRIYDFTKILGIVWLVLLVLSALLSWVLTGVVSNLTLVENTEVINIETKPEEKN